MKYKLTLLLEIQNEGGFTITCKELPELVTECDSLEEMRPNVIDAFAAIIELYQYRKRSLPKGIRIIDDSAIIEDNYVFETVVAFDEISGINQKTEMSWV